MVDATCAPVNIRRARKDYLAYAKAKKHSKKQTRNAIKKQLSYVRRDLSYLESFGYALGKGEIPLFLTIRTLYQQQKRMYDNKVHSVADRIVSICQPWVRPIVRGKVKAPTEFGAKLDISLDEKGYVRLERVSFDAYNEGVYLQEAIKRYYARCGHYPKRVLVDQIYRTRENRRFCKEHGIRMSGPKLGRPSKKEQSKQEKGAGSCLKACASGRSTFASCRATYPEIEKTSPRRRKGHCSSRKA